MKKLTTDETIIVKIAEVLEKTTIDRSKLKEIMVDAGIVLDSENMGKLLDALENHKTKIKDKMVNRRSQILAEKKKSITAKIAETKGDITRYKKELEYAQKAGKTDKVTEYSNTISTMEESIKLQQEILSDPTKKVMPMEEGGEKKSLSDMVTEQYNSEMSFIYINTMDWVFAEPLLL